MCGRYASNKSPDAVRKAFKLSEDGPRPNVQPRWNIAPTQAAPVVREDGGQRHLVLLRWGLIPSWASDASIGAKLINARAETLAEKPAFRGALRQRRCLVVADGFYEWKSEGKAKQPYYVTRKDREVFAFAGLWERWTPLDAGSRARALESFTIVTTEATGKLRDIHLRTPVILDASGAERWLAAPDPAVLRAIDPDLLDLYPVGTRVNAVANDDPSLVEPVEAAARMAPQQGLLF